MKIRFVDIADAPTRGAAVVVDVLRAFTTAAWSFHLGAERLILVRGIDEALALKDAIPGALAFCDGQPRPGFDLFNSPAQLQLLDVQGRTIIQRTTAGTQGAVASTGCDPLLCTGFVTATATARALIASGCSEVTFVVTGGDEDRACADHIAAILTGDPAPADALDRADRSAAAVDLRQGVDLGYSGVHPDDIALCLQLDRFDFAMYARPIDGQLELDVVRSR